MDPLFMIDNLPKFTPETVQKLRELHEESIVLPNLRVGVDDFYQWEGSERLPVEYRKDAGRIIIIAPGNPIHQSLESVLKSWFSDIATELSDEKRTRYQTCMLIYQRSHETMVKRFQTRPFSHTT